MLPNYVLAAERLEMAHAVETRLPFLDHLLFDAIRPLQPASLTSRTEGKRALRRATRRIVPEAVRTRGKHPFAAPSQLANPRSLLHRRVNDTLHSGVLDEMSVFDAPAVLSLWTKFPTMALAQQHALEPVWLMTFGLCVLHQRYIAAPRLT